MVLEIVITDTSLIATGKNNTNGYNQCLVLLVCRLYNKGVIVSLAAKPTNCLHLLGWIADVAVC